MASLIPSNLYDGYKLATNLLSNYHGIVRVFSHYDADGIAAAGILAKTLYRFGKSFNLTCRKNLDPEFFEQLKKEKNKLLIIADMGTNQALAIKEYVEYLIVLDHHEPSDEIREWHRLYGAEPEREKGKLVLDEKRSLESRNILLLNSHLYGIDGTKEACASTMCFLFSIFCNPTNWDLLPFAIAGCEGDRQNSDGKFHGLNRWIIEEGTAHGIVEKRRTFSFDGETVYDALSTTNDPFFRMFVEKPGRISEALAKLSIPEKAKMGELTPEQIKKLNSFLSLQYLREDVDLSAVLTLCREDYFTKIGIRAKTLANYLNACGRTGKQELAVGLFFDFDRYADACAGVRNAYREKVRKYLLRLLKDGTNRLEAIQYTWVEEAEFAGAIGGLALTFFLDKTKPVFVLSKKENVVSISARGLDSLVKEGLNLAECCRIAAEKCGGRGGGHNIAAGAEVPEGKEEDFLKLADEIVKSQRKNSG
ncbi:MAG: DHH family phosphoesterase [Thermoplasmata archaeon]|nr:DHH family phosphoesterase [Thermoplasmata archaeon]